jgi:predicted nuclease of predicted toxin-antitoxin system
MRILVDSCLPPRLAKALTDRGHDALHVDQIGADPGDEVILEFALRERRVIVTQDKDFGALAVQAAGGASGIIRIKRVPNRLLLSLIVNALNRHQSDLLAGAILTVEAGRLRIRRLPRL